MYNTPLNFRYLRKTFKDQNLFLLKPSSDDRRFVNPAQLYTPSRTNLNHKNGHGAVGENSVDPSRPKVAGFTPISPIKIIFHFCRGKQIYIYICIYI